METTVQTMILLYVIFFFTNSELYGAHLYIVRWNFYVALDPRNGNTVFSSSSPCPELQWTHALHHNHHHLQSHQWTGSFPWYSEEDGGPHSRLESRKSKVSDLLLLFCFPYFFFLNLLGSSCDSLYGYVGFCIWVCLRTWSFLMTISHDNVRGFSLALSSSFFIGSSFIVKKKGLKRAGDGGVRAGLFLCFKVFTIWVLSI